MADKSNSGWGWLWWGALVAGGFALLSSDALRDRRDYWLTKISSGTVVQAKEAMRTLEQAGRALREKGKAAIELGGLESRANWPGEELNSKKLPADNGKTEAAAKLAPPKDKLTNEDRKALDKLVNGL